MIVFKQDLNYVKKKGGIKFALINNNGRYWENVLMNYGWDAEVDGVDVFLKRFRIQTTCMKLVRIWSMFGLFLVLLSESKLW